MTAPLFTFDPTISFSNPNTVVLSGTASGDFTKVDITAVGSTPSDLGSPQINDGHWSLSIPLAELGSGAEFTLSATDSTATVSSFDSNFGIGLGITDHPYTTFQFTSDGSLTDHFNFFNQNGALIYQSDAEITGSNSASILDTGHQLHTTFVFLDGVGTTQQTIVNFHVTGASHDTVSLPPSDFTSLADVLRHTTMSNGSATIHDPNNSGDTLTLMGVTKAELKSNPHDFTFHGTGTIS